MSAVKLSKIISGGQTGADQGGLEAATELGIPTGGWCPKGWRTERGPDLALKAFGLEETNSLDYISRTILNVRVADGTVIFGDTRSTGSRLTIDCCERNHKPYLLNPDGGELREWIIEQGIAVLNVAGNRESFKRGIQSATKDYLVRELRAASVSRKDADHEP